MIDFTINRYVQLLEALQSQGYHFQTFTEYIQSPRLKTSILRHDVDKLPGNSLRFAKIQAGMGIKGSYYFRAVTGSWDEEIIKEIVAMGHEVGYHYETMDTCKGDVDKAYKEFCENLQSMRKLGLVSTICMHGSPRSKFDNRDIWKKYDYKKLGLIGEPYYDIDFNQVFYLTDTGRKWDGWKSSVRDKVPQQEGWVKQGLEYHSTIDIIQAAMDSTLPSKIMFTFHPQRWADSFVPWAKEIVLQSVKNQVKKVLFF